MTTYYQVKGGFQRIQQAIESGSMAVIINTFEDRNENTGVSGGYTYTDIWAKDPRDIVAECTRVFGEDASFSLSEFGGDMLLNISAG